MDKKFLIIYDEGIYKFFSEDKNEYRIRSDFFGFRVIPELTFEEEANFYMREITDTNLRVETFDLVNSEETEETKTFELDTTEDVFGYEIDKSFITAGEEVISGSFNVEGGRAIVTINAPVPNKIRVQFSYYGSKPLVENQNYDLTINDQTETFTCAIKNDTLYLGDYDYFMGTGEETKPDSEEIEVDSTGKTEIFEYISYSDEGPTQYKIVLQKEQIDPQEFYLFSKRVIVDEQTLATAAYVGNLSRYDSEKEDTGEPFCIITRDLDEEGNYETFFYADEGSYNLTLELYKSIQIPELAGVALVSFGNKQGDKLEDNYGIGINSGDTELTLPPRAISLFETELGSTKPQDRISFNYRGILGTLLTSEEMEDSVDTTIYQHLAETQGIYTDNMYIGDKNQYLAFYSDINDRTQKNLAIKANQISFLAGNQYTQMSKHFIFDDNGFTIAKDSSKWKVRVGDESVDIIDGTSGIDKIKAQYGEGASFYDEESKRTAYIGSNLITIGKNEEQHIDINNNASVYYNKYGGAIAEISQGDYGITQVNMNAVEHSNYGEFKLSEDTEVDSSKNYYAYSLYNFTPSSLVGDDNEYNGITWTWSTSQKGYTANGTLERQQGSYASAGGPINFILPKGEYEIGKYNGTWLPSGVTITHTIFLRASSGKYYEITFENQPNITKTLSLLNDEIITGISIGHEIVNTTNNSKYIDNIRFETLIRGLKLQKVSNPTGNPKEKGYYESSKFYIKYLTKDKINEEPIEIDFAAQIQNNPSFGPYFFNIKPIDNTEVVDSSGQFKATYLNDEIFVEWVGGTPGTVSYVEENNFVGNTLEYAPANNTLIEMTIPLNFTVRQSSMTVYFIGGVPGNIKQEILVRGSSSEYKTIYISYYISENGREHNIVYDDVDDAINYDSVLTYRYTYAYPQVIYPGTVTYKGNVRQPFYTFGTRTNVETIEYDVADISRGNYSFTIGEENAASGNRSVSLGKNVINMTDNSLVVGEYNDGHATPELKTTTIKESFYKSSDGVYKFSKPINSFTNPTSAALIRQGDLKPSGYNVLTQINIFEYDEEVSGTTYLVLNELKTEATLYGGSLVDFDYLSIEYEALKKANGYPFAIGNGELEITDTKAGYSKTIDEKIVAGKMYYQPVRVIRPDNTYLEHFDYPIYYELINEKYIATEDTEVDTSKTYYRIYPVANPKDSSLSSYYDGAYEKVEKRSNAFTIDWYGNIMGQGMAGFIQMFAGNNAPPGWLICDGREVSIDYYPELYSVIGNTYGEASDNEHFLLPDLRNRFPVGVGDTYTLNSKGGSPYIQAHTHGFTQPKIPNHTHGMGNLWSNGTGSSLAYTMSSNRKLQTRNTTNSGGGGACTGGAVGAVSGVSTGSSGNLPPYIGINFIICTGKTN